MSSTLEADVRCGGFCETLFHLPLPLYTLAKLGLPVYVLFHFLPAFALFRDTHFALLS